MVERLGTARNSISSCASRGHRHHVALLLNVTYRFPYRRVTRNEPSSVLKILQRPRHTNRGSSLFPVSCISARVACWSFSKAYRKHFMPRLYIYGVLGIANQRFLVHRQWCQNEYTGNVVEKINYIFLLTPSITLPVFSGITNFWYTQIYSSDRYFRDVVCKN